MPQSLVQFHLPDLLARWPYPRLLNTHYAEVKAASAAWLESFNAFDAKAQRAFNLCDFNLLSSLAYPHADKKRLRTACDLMNLFFVIDEYSDLMDEHAVKALVDIVMDAMRNTEKVRPQGEPIYGEIARQYWQRAIRTATLSSQHRFLDTFQSYLSSVVQEAADRVHYRILDIDSYLVLRRQTVGAWPSFALLELEMDIPDHVMNHPIVKHLTICAIDMILIDNDICSYDVEQAHGKDGHNIVTIAMRELEMDICEVMAWLGRLHGERMSSFLARRADLPRWGEEIDRQITEYIDGIANWVRANVCWSFESERYFGKRGKQIQKSRMIQLSPKAC